MPVLQLAAAASAAAGLVHAAAAGSHSADRTLAAIFAVTAAVQLGWAALAATRPSRRVAQAGVALGVIALLAWLVSRTTGLPLGESLSGREEVGVQDGLAALFAGVSALLSVLALAGVTAPRKVSLRLPVVVLGSVAMLGLAIPAMAAEHQHGSHEHGDEHDADGHDEQAGGHEHAHGADAAAAGPDGSHAAHAGTPVISLTDERVTDEQRNAAQQLIDDTTAGMARFPTVESVQAAGYVSIGDSVTGWEHYVHIGHMSDGVDLDPNAIESVVFKVYPDGTRQVASAMYILGFGSTMDDVPDIAGELTSWHDHQDLCWEGVRVVGTTRATGKCERGSFRGTAPMLHVWMINNECGPFAGIEGSHGSGCAHSHDDETTSAAAGAEETASGP